MTWWGAVLVGVTLYCKDLADRYIYIYIHLLSIESAGRDFNPPSLVYKTRAWAS